LFPVRVSIHHASIVLDAVILSILILGSR
jgi:hypothetical protein